VFINNEDVGRSFVEQYLGLMSPSGATNIGRPSSQQDHVRPTNGLDLASARSGIK
jgi:hypothetical protein